MADGRQAKLDPHATRGTQLGEVVPLLATQQLPSSNYLRSAAIKRTHGNEIVFRFYFKQTTASRKCQVLVCEGDTDPTTSAIVGGPQTKLDTSADRLEANAFTIDETTDDDQGNDGYYVYDVRCRAPYTWVGVKGDGATVAGDTIKVDAYEALSL